MRTLLRSIFVAFVVALAVPAGAQIRMSGSGVVNPAFIQQGTGATARTFLDKARDAVNVKDYGAKCDGSTDDRTAFNDALTAATGKMLVVGPGGTCKLGDTITIPASTTLQLEGAALTFTNAAATGEIQVNGADVRIIGRGASTITCVSLQCIFSSGAVNVDRLVVDGVRVVESPAGAGHCLQLNNTGTANDVTVRNSRFEGCRYGVLINDAMSAANNVQVIANRFYAIWAVAVEVNRPTLGSSNVIVAENYIELDPTGTGLTTDGFAISSDRTSYQTIADNVIGVARREVMHFEGEGANGNDYLTIRGNAMQCVRDCIQVLGAGKNTTITGNVMHGNAAAGMYGITFPDSTQYTQRVVADNIVENVDTGINFGAPAALGVIQGNYVKGGAVCIHVNGAQGDQISHNVLDGCTTGITAEFGGIVGRNTFDGVTTLANVLTTGKLILRGVTERFRGIALAGAGNTDTTVLPSGTQLTGTGRFTLTTSAGGTTWTARQSTLVWNGSSFTETNAFGINGGGATGNGSFIKTGANIQARVFNGGGAITGNLTFEFDGDLVLP